jgi:hypothetical protein
MRFFVRALLYSMFLKWTETGMALGKSTARFTIMRTPVSDRTLGPNVRTSTVQYPQSVLSTQYPYFIADQDLNLSRETEGSESAFFRSRLSIDMQYRTEFHTLHIPLKLPHRQSQPIYHRAAATAHN